MEERKRSRRRSRVTMRPTWAINATATMNEQGIAQNSLTKVFDVDTAGAVGHYFNGRREPTIEQLQRLAKHLGVTIDRLVNPPNPLRKVDADYEAPKESTPSDISKVSLKYDSASKTTRKAVLALLSADEQPILKESLVCIVETINAVTKIDRSIRVAKVINKSKETKKLA